MKFHTVAAVAAISTLLACAPGETDEAETGWQVDTEAVTGMLTGAIENQRIAGAVSVIYKDGEEVFSTALGDADREAGEPMTRETLFQIYSMSKPVTGVAIMTLYEDGLFELDDPLSDYLPGFENMMVFEGMDEDGEPVLVPAERQITILDVLTHSAGFGYNPEGNDYVSGLYAEDIPLDPSHTLEEMTEILSGLPLLYQPGAQWRYSIAVDVQARLVEVLSGMSFHDYLQQEIFDPLGMDEARRFLTPEEVDRLAAAYTNDGEGNLVRVPDEQFYAYNSGEKPMEMGGSGLVMPIDDYVTFARMLLNEGELNGARILEPETVELMATDHLDWPLDDTQWLDSKGHVGFGVDFAVRTAPPSAASENAGAVGEFFWDGYASTLFWVDPENDLTAVMLVQKVPFDGTLHTDFRNAVYAGTDHVYQAPEEMPSDQTEE